VEGRIRNTTLWIVIAAAFAVFIPPIVLVSRQSMYEVADALLCGAALGFFVGSSPASWDVLKLPSHSIKAHEYFIVGSNLVSLFATSRFGGQWYWRATDKPEWWIDSIPLLLTTIGMSLGFFMMMISTTSDKGVLLPQGYFKTSALFALSGAIAAVLIWAGWG
jgi:hypothetical protein